MPRSWPSAPSATAGGWSRPCWPGCCPSSWPTSGWRAGRGARLAYAATKLCFLLSLALAIALDLRRLFFLIIILPVILLLFIAFARFGAWAWRRTGHPWIAALGNAAILAWAIAAIFPLVAR